jgi:hypothetical protein
VIVCVLAELAVTVTVQVPETPNVQEAPIVSVPILELNDTVPLGVEGVPVPVSATVTVTVLAWPTITEAGERPTVVDVGRTPTDRVLLPVLVP